MHHDIFPLADLSKRKSCCSMGIACAHWDRSSHRWKNGAALISYLARIYGMCYKMNNNYERTMEFNHMNEWMNRIVSLPFFSGSENILWLKVIKMQFPVAAHNFYLCCMQHSRVTWIARVHGGKHGGSASPPRSQPSPLYCSPDGCTMYKYTANGIIFALMRSVGCEDLEKEGRLRAQRAREKYGWLGHNYTVEI